MKTNNKVNTYNFSIVLNYLMKMFGILVICNFELIKHI